MAETVALTSVIGTVTVSIIGELRNSRCTHIELGCISCDRDVTDDVVTKKKSTEKSTTSSQISQDTDDYSEK